MGECNRCGKCCFYPTGDRDENNALILKPCGHLKTDENGKYLCDIYNKRLGLLIGVDKFDKKYYCTLYNSMSAEIEGCPMNIGNKPLANVEIKNGIALKTGPKEALFPMSSMIPIIRINENL